MYGLVRITYLGFECGHSDFDCFFDLVSTLALTAKNYLKEAIQTIQLLGFQYNYLRSSTSNDEKAWSVVNH